MRALLAITILGGGTALYFVGRGAAKKRGYAKTQLGATIYGVPFTPRTEFTTKPALIGGRMIAGGGGGFEPKPL